MQVHAPRGGACTGAICFRPHNWSCAEIRLRAGGALPARFRCTRARELIASVHVLASAPAARAAQHHIAAMRHRDLVGRPMPVSQLIKSFGIVATLLLTM